MSAKVVKDCRRCEAKGFTLDAKFKEIECIDCDGTGSVDAKEARKTVALPMSIYMMLSRAAHKEELSRVQMVKKLLKGVDDE